MKNKERKSNAGKILGYAIGSVVLCAAACIIVPEVLPKFSGALNKKMTKTASKKHDENDWGPEIVKKTNCVEGEKK